MSKMTDENRIKAIKIVSEASSAKVSFNVPVKDSYCNVHEILIHECSAALINTFVKEGYSLYMGTKGLSVTKF